MKAKLFALTLMLTPLLAVAADETYLYNFIANPVTGKAYQSLIAKQGLPKWVAGGGVSTPTKEIKINGQQYLLLSGCKPHNCPSESIAILYSPDKKVIHGVFEEYDEKGDKQKLVWLNLASEGTESQRTVLFAEISKDLEAHPENYNF